MAALSTSCMRDKVLMRQEVILTGFDPTQSQI